MNFSSQISSVSRDSEDVKNSLIYVINTKQPRLTWFIHVKRPDLPEFVVRLETLGLHIVNYKKTICESMEKSHWHLDGLQQRANNLHCILYKLLSSFLANKWE